MVCGVACNQGFHACGNSCLSNTSANSCGTSCTACPSPQNGLATCNGGRCGIVCNDNFHVCGTSCVRNDSTDSCGGACTPCPEPDEGTATCDGQSCGAICDDGLELRGSSCERVPIQVSAGGSTRCALFSDGSVACWGSNFNGELGTRTSEFSSSTPLLIAGLPRARQISVGDGAICALIDADGSVRCWGGNTVGQLGNGSTVATSAVPVQVTGVTGATVISQSGVHACAVLGDGSVRCWGDNDNGQLGNGTSGASADAPVTVANLGGSARTVSAGVSGFRTCAVLTSGSVRCWGLSSGDQGILGNGVLGPGGSIATQPVTAIGINNAASVSVGQTHTCAVLTSGGVRCWGINFVGQVGNGNTDTVLSPVAVEGGNDVSAVALGATFTCAQLDGGTVSCWGGNPGGSLGNGSTVSQSLTPVTAIGLTGVTSLAAGSFHACALAGDDSVRCWGAGQLNGEDVSVPTLVEGL